MFLISHRGNIDGPDKLNENNPDYILNALKKGFDVEIDVWSVNNKFFLGHDKPQYQVDKKFLINTSFWCHAKDINSFYNVLKIGAHCFFHQKDDVTLTSKGFMWTYPGKTLMPMSICVMPELNNYKNIKNKCAGFCSDYIKEIKNEKLKR